MAGVPGALHSVVSPQPAATQQLVLIILNNTLPAMTRTFWRRAQVRLCADGGANRLHSVAAQWAATSGGSPASRREEGYVPDVIAGDLDSVTPDVLQHYQQRGSRVVDLSCDQDSTDFEKCLALGQQLAPPESHFLALGALGGRLDHTLANLNTLYKHPGLALTLCGEGNLVRLLPRGRHVLAVDRGREGPEAGLAALGPGATVSTSGLQWDMDKLRLEVGGQQSTSNKVVSDTVRVETDAPLLWTTSFQDRDEEPP